MNTPTTPTTIYLIRSIGYTLGLANPLRTLHGSIYSTREDACCALVAALYEQLSEGRAEVPEAIMRKHGYASEDGWSAAVERVTSLADLAVLINEIGEYEAWMDTAATALGAEGINGESGTWYRLGNDELYRDDNGEVRTRTTTEEA